MTVAILALQGAFIEHQKKIESLGHNCIELRCKEDLNKPFDRLILPGGESTAQGKLLRELEMFTPIQHMIENGMPVLGTCAGLILLAETIDGESPYLGTLPVTVKRNAYGRQLGSFYTEGVFGDWESIFASNWQSVQKTARCLQQSRETQWVFDIKTKLVSRFIPSLMKIRVFMNCFCRFKYLQVYI